MGTKDQDRSGRKVQRLKSEAIAKREQKITDELEVPGPSEFEEIHGYTVDEDPDEGGQKPQPDSRPCG